MCIFVQYLYYITVCHTTGIFADFKKNQSRQAEDILNRHRNDRQTKGAGGPGGSHNASSSNLRSTSSLANTMSSTNTLFGAVAKAGSSLANTLTSGTLHTHTLPPVHEPASPPPHTEVLQSGGQGGDQGVERKRGNRRRPSLVKGNQ